MRCSFLCVVQQTVMMIQMDLITNKVPNKGCEHYPFSRLYVMLQVIVVLNGTSNTLAEGIVMRRAPPPLLDDSAGR